MSVFTSFGYNRVNARLRTIQPTVEAALFKGKVVAIYGAQQVGKTTLCRASVSRYLENTVAFNCSEPDVQVAFTDRNTRKPFQFLN